jgi:hypothetical protein
MRMKCSLAGRDTGSMDATKSHARRRIVPALFGYSADTIEPAVFCAIAPVLSGEDSFAPFTGASTTKMHPTTDTSISPITDREIANLLFGGALHRSFHAAGSKSIIA